MISLNGYPFKSWTIAKNENESYLWTGQAITNEYDYFDVCRVEEVESIKSQLAKKDKLIEELMGALESSNMEINDWHMGEDSHCNWNNMLIEKAKNLIGEK